MASLEREAQSIVIHPEPQEPTRIGGQALKTKTVLDSLVFAVSRPKILGVESRQFHPGAPGRLVLVTHSWTDLRAGRAVTQAAKVSAFVPDAPPVTAELVPHIAPVLSENEAAILALGRLDGYFRQIPSGFRIDPWILLRPLRLREARLSSKIENTVATSMQVGLAELQPTERVETREVMNYFRAVDLVIDSPQPISEVSIRAMHAELLRGIPGAERKLPGRYRESTVFLGDEHRPITEARFVPPPPHEVARLMAELVAFITSPPRDMPRLISAAIAHYQFETIHPFADGNGRLGRMLITLSLADGSFLKRPFIYPSGYIDQHKQAYYDAILRVSTHGDWQNWFAYFLTAVRFEAERSLVLLQQAQTLRDSFSERVGRRSLGKSFDRALDLLFERPALTVQLMHDHVGGTLQTARNYLDIMSDAGIVQQAGRAGRRAVFVCPEIFAISDTP